MNAYFMDSWDEYPRRSIDRESTIRAIAGWIDGEGSLMPYVELRSFDGFRVGVRDPKDKGLLHAPNEHGYRSAATAFAEFGELIDTAMRRLDGSEPWPEGPALEEIKQYQREREESKLDTLATLFISREPHLIEEIKEGSRVPNPRLLLRINLDTASLPECLWDALEVEGQAFREKLEEEIWRRVMGK